MVNHRGFTMIELVIVLMIIIILTSMVIAGAKILRRQRLVTQTDTIIAALRLSLEATAGERGGTVGAVEHPLAGSAAPRNVFLRDATWAVLDTTSEALVVEDLNWIESSARSRVIRRNDVFQGGDTMANAAVPLLYGLRRGEIGVLSACDRSITAFRRLPHKDTQFWDASANRLRSPYDSSVYPDGICLYAPLLEPGVTLESASRHVTAYVTGSTAGKELVDLKAVYDEADGTLLFGTAPNGRVRQDSKDTSSDPSWRIGRMRDAGSWKRYRLRGSTFYDAWGSEILVSTAPNGSLRITSAGPDGVFCWSPGADGIYQTPPYNDPRNSSPLGDDKSGVLDNRGDEIWRGEP